MLTILSLTGVIFVLIAIGYILVVSGAFDRNHMQVLTHYVVMLALPALIFRAVANNSLGQIINPAYILTYVVASLTLFIAYYFWASRVCGQNALYSTFAGMGASSPNSSFIGYPIVLMFMPSLASTALAMNVIVENLLLIPLAMLLAERSNGSEALNRAVFLDIARRLLLNPIMIGLLAGLVISISAIELPMVLSRPVDIIADSSAAVSLIVIGGAIAGMPRTSISGRLIPLSVGKLLLHPMLFWLVSLGLASLGMGIADADLTRAGILMAAMPPMGIYPILAQRYGAGDEHAAAMVIMTVCSFGTITTLLWMLNLTTA
ncbi:AEC family transporter [Granulosicoccus sp. 3-233]|uniref:AEC family transporter n=1 Tax=Granulosicoccus sp. 3-233 TaxID=3417969 RepID=UPI003D333889